jgi:predicted Zn-ribbon and HTH transcriptional regulator
MPTIRQKIISLLEEDEMGARELSGALGISEKEIYEHLSHIARSIASQRKKVKITPANCLVCGYVFEDRQRYTRPGRCPKCRKSHLQSPKFRIGQKIL